MRTRLEYNIETLNEWFKLMFEADPNAHISLKSSKFMHLIMNNATKKNYIIFDNAGGCAFDIWEVRNKEAVEEMLKTIGTNLVYGTVINGKAELAEHQKTHPHWNIQALMRRKHLEELKRKYVGKKVEVTFYAGYDFPDLKDKDIRVVDVDDNEMCSLEVDGKPYKHRLGIGGEVNLIVDQTPIEK